MTSYWTDKILIFQNILVFLQETLSRQLIMKTITKVKFLQRLFLFIEWIVLLGLVISAAFFVRDVVSNFKLHHTSMKALVEESSLMENPTIVLCFQPSIKSSILQKYNVTTKQFHYAKVENLNISWIEFSKDLSYKIGIDFEIILFLNDDVGQAIRIQNTSLTQNQSKMIHFEVVNTLEAGLCYKITPKLKTPRNAMNFIAIAFNQELADEDIPNLKLIFTSEENSFGIINMDWVEGDEFIVEVDPKLNLSHGVNFKAVRQERLELTTRCGKESFYKCLSKR